MASKIWRNLLRTAAVACFVAGSTAQAGGVFYQSDCDPLGFACSAKWFVDDNCGLGGKGNGYYLVNALGPACNVSLYSLTVQLWESNPTSAAFPDVDAARANPVGSKFLELEFDSEYTTPPSASPYHVFGLPDPHLVVGISVLNHELAGLDTLLIGPECGNNGGEFVGCFGVQFTSGALGFLAVPSLPALENLGDKGAYLWEQSPTWWNPGCRMSQFFFCASEVTTFVNGIGHATFETAGSSTGFRLLGRSPDGPTVPEPGSLALLGGALVAGWLTRRRKAAA